jgi:Uma2 family endonuclease
MSQIINETKKSSGRPFEIPLNANGEPAPLDNEGKLSFEAFLEWMDEDTHAEWVDGVIEMTSPASGKHLDIGGFLHALLVQYSRYNDLGIVRLHGFQMKLPDLPSREPDLIFIKKQNSARLKNTYLDGPGDLVVEIVSPESNNRDYNTKFKEYAKGGVSEYWLIDQRNDTAKFYVLENGKYLEVKPQNGRYTSREIAGFWLQVDWLWQNPLPNPNRIMKLLGGVPFKSQELDDQLDEDGDEYAKLMINRLMAKDREKYADLMVQELREKGYLPPENS